LFAVVSEDFSEMVANHSCVMRHPNEFCANSLMLVKARPQHAQLTKKKKKRRILWSLKGTINGLGRWIFHNRAV